MGLISTRKLGKSGVSQCSERLDIHMINKSIQRSCQWEVVFQMFLSDVIFLELGSPRWRCNWNFGKVLAWSGLGSCFWNIQFCSSPCQGPRGAGSQAQGVGYGLLWGLYGIQEPAHGKPLCRSCSPQHWGGTFSFSNAKNSFRNAAQLHGAHLLPDSKLWGWFLIKPMRHILCVLAELCSGWENKLILKTAKKVLLGALSVFCKTEVLKWSFIFSKGTN